MRKEKELNTRELNKLKEERRILTMQQEEMNNLSRYIRQQGKLRYNPILDPIQNKIKTTHLYDGKTIVINGGPGTGKTTTMIQRLKYLIDEYAIKESFDNNSQIYKLSVSQYNLLLELIKSNKELARLKYKNIDGEYDVAISFMWPHHFVAKKVRAKVNYGGLPGTKPKKRK